MKWHKIQIDTFTVKFKFGRYKRGYRKFKGWGDLAFPFLLIRWWFADQP